MMSSTAADAVAPASVDEELEAPGPGVPSTPVEEREQPDPDPRGSKKSGAPVRTYVVLEQGRFEDTDEPYFTEVGRVESRNATNAIRKAFRELDRADEELTLAVVPESMWRPTPVKLARRESLSVAIG